MARAAVEVTFPEAGQVTMSEPLIPTNGAPALIDIGPPASMLSSLLAPASPPVAYSAAIAVGSVVRLRAVTTPGVRSSHSIGISLAKVEAFDTEAGLYTVRPMDGSFSMIQIPTSTSDNAARVPSRELAKLKAAPIEEAKAALSDHLMALPAGPMSGGFFGGRHLGLGLAGWLAGWLAADSYM